MKEEQKGVCRRGTFSRTEDLGRRERGESVSSHGADA